jgi:hypothetical protein
MTNYKTLVAASLMSIALTSYAFAQCTECAIYPDRDNLNGGAQTPAGKMGLVRPGGAAGVVVDPNVVNNANSPNNARAEFRDQRSRRGYSIDGNLTNRNLGARTVGFGDRRNIRR